MSAGVGAVIKEIITKDAKGKMIRSETVEMADTAKCWHYTWMGPETEKTNNTGSCLDLGMDVNAKPCFPPIVWTVNDEYGENEPDLNELEEQCNLVGCNPFCTPGPSERCMKYTEWSKESGGKMIYTSKYCGTVTDWTGNHVSKDNCYRTNRDEYCFCNKEMKINCNSGRKISAWRVLAVFAIICLAYL